MLIYNFLISKFKYAVLPIPIAAQWVFGSSLAGIAGSNTAEVMRICLFWVLCVDRYRPLRRVDHSSRGVLPSVACLIVDLETSAMSRSWPIEAAEQ